ncbi:MAG: 1-acyl-sn-glycerol-3-phosphate acyltransferase [Chloroflexi bacterium]|nr:MAG: 1-acyl-sn-glycerol-3-phosphate acyltransferase [Chloroflexota bacterium]
MIDSILATAAQIVAGSTVRWAGCAPSEEQRIYIANHSSHLDFIVLWSYLPPWLRRRTRPVAARDYWARDVIRRYLAARVFNAVLIDRAASPGTPAGQLGRQAVDQMIEALGDQHSLILFPEGTRGSGDEVAPFRSGLFHLCRAKPQVAVVPVYLENLNRILPKGHLLPVPILSRITFGTPLRLQPDETKDAFLQRARESVRALKAAA